MEGKRTFTCWKCKGTFQSDWTEADAEAEYTAIFGKHLGEERDVLCNACDADFKAWFKSQDMKKITS